MSGTGAGPASTPVPAASARALPGRSYGRLLPALPAGMVLIVLFLGSMVFMTLFSFWQVNSSFVIEPDWTLENYTRFFTSAAYLRTFGKTLVMAGVVTLTCLSLAIPFCYFLVRYLTPRWARIVLLAVIIPFWTSYLLRVYAWQAILGEFGALNQALMWLGVIDEPSRLLVYNDLGVFIVLSYVQFPFAALAIYASMERFDFSQFLAAQDLGARPDQAFRRILLPQLRPGIITACIFVSVPILGEFLTPTIVGGVQGVLIANLVVNFFKGAQIPQGAAMAIIIAAFVTAVLIVFRRYLRVEDVVTRG